MPGLEKKSLAQFEQEIFELVDDGAFQVGFGISGLFRQTEEFQHIGFLEQVLWVGDGLKNLRRQLADAVLVPAESEAFIEPGIELTGA